MRSFFRNGVVWGFFLASAMAYQPDVAQGEPAVLSVGAIDAWMQAGDGERAGALVSGEILRSALVKRERVDSASAGAALGSMSKMLDFRLSRSGDRYVYRVEGGGRKLTLLRYQRSNHVYETVLNDSGEYVTRLIDVPRNGEGEVESGQVGVVGMGDEDEEVDVEQAAMAAQLGRGRGETGDLPTREAQGEGHLDESPLPLEAKLAKLPSPDQEYPDAGLVRLDGEDGEDALQEGGGDDPVLKEGAGVGVDENPDEKALKRDAAPFGQAAQAASEMMVMPVKYRHEDTGCTQPGLMMLIMGGVLFLLGFGFVIMPSMLARMRLGAAGFRVVRMIGVTPFQRLALVECQGMRYLVCVMRGKMQLVTPCTDDGLAMAAFLKAGSYWHEMARRPLSDRQLAALVEAYRVKFGRRMAAHEEAPQKEKGAQDEAGLWDDSWIGDVCVEENEPENLGAENAGHESGQDKA